MANRHRAALAIIDPGAVNPQGILVAMQDTCAEIRSEPGFVGTETFYKDPALRLMCHQLSYLLNIQEFETGSIEGYSHAVAACKKEAA